MLRGTWPPRSVSSRPEQSKLEECHDLACFLVRFAARHSAFAQQRADREKHQKGILIDFMTTIENDAVHLGTSVIRQELFDDTGTIAPNPLQ
ncbi:hypothetical protein Bcen2424_5763 [Burkholderia cenocepacia HI2424]|nr:hypothetical protein Bcen2424_5763 [Burkholderia cenocepacia HI2424]